MVTRIVGSSDTAAIPIRCVWVSTGNNPTLHQETARRVVRCRLDAEVEKPWLGRTFKISNLKDWLRENRPKMVWAVLTLIRSWCIAGQPKGHRRLGGFESYSQIVGGILAHANIEGFLHEDALVEADAEDLQTEAERWFVTRWWTEHGESQVSVPLLLELVNRDDSPVLELWGPDARVDTYSRRLGQFIRTIKGKTVKVESAEGRCAVCVRKCGDDSVTRTARYRLGLAREEAREGRAINSEQRLQIGPARAMTIAASAVIHRDLGTATEEQRKQR
jgi:hypothetical protein